jgi:hypothetical protein
VEDTDALHSEEVVGGVGVVVDTTEERSRGVLADVLDDQVRSTRVFVYEGGYVVDETTD